MTFQFIYAFHMPLFMMLSGCFLGKIFKLNPIQFLQKRFVQLLLPVLTFSCLFVIGNHLKALFTPTASTVNFFSYLGSGWMWFLKYLFVDTVIAYASRRLLHKEWLAALLPTLLLFCLTRNTMFRLLPYLWAGYYIYKHKAFFDRHLNTMLAVSAMSFAVFLIFWKGDYDAAHRFVFFKPSFHLEFAGFYMATVRLLVGMAGSMTFIFFFKWLYSRIDRLSLTRICCKVGRQTLGIYCLQIYILEEALTRLCPLTFHFTGDVIARCLIAAVILAVCSFGVSLLERSRWTALLFLGKSRKKDPGESM